MYVINKYLTESKLRGNNDIKNVIVSKKSGTYDIGGKRVKVNVVDDTMVFVYPSSMVDFTYNIAKICDDLGYDYTQIGIDNKKNMKFIIDMS